MVIYFVSDKVFGDTRWRIS